MKRSMKNKDNPISRLVGLICILALTFTISGCSGTEIK